MFTGIVECLGNIVNVTHHDGNTSFQIKSPWKQELILGQSIAHDGVCLTINQFKEDDYIVTAIQETLNKTNLENKKVGDRMNLERCMPVNGRFDGHIVQGHVDGRFPVTSVRDLGGSYEMVIQISHEHLGLVVPKGSITLNWVSLTVVTADQQGFVSVHLIPHTWEHTNLSSLKVADFVNVEFDILGKYIQKAMTLRGLSL